MSPCDHKTKVAEKYQFLKFPFYLKYIRTVMHRKKQANIDFRF